MPEVCLMKGEGYSERMKKMCIHPLKLISAPNGVTLKRTRAFTNEEGVMDNLNEPRKKKEKRKKPFLGLWCVCGLTWIKRTTIQKA
jgi:hypothetical protein